MNFINGFPTEMISSLLADKHEDFGLMGSLIKVVMVTIKTKIVVLSFGE